MKYILMMNTMKAGHKGIEAWTKDEIETHIEYMLKLNKDLTDSGEFIFAEGLTFPDQAKLVRANKDGRPITDGIFPESKEFLAGFWIVDVATPERAYEIAATASAAPGPRGQALNMPIEVRPIMSAPPKKS